MGRRVKFGIFRGANRVLGQDFMHGVIGLSLNRSMVKISQLGCYIAGN